MVISSLHRAGLTLLELLSVVTILSLMVGMLLPVLGNAREKARIGVCLNNLRQLQTAWSLYTEDYNGWMPLNTSVLKYGLWESSPDSWIGASHAVRDHLPASIQQSVFFKKGYLTTPGILRCPSDDSLTYGNEENRLRSYALNGNLAGRKDEIQQTAWNLNRIARPSTTFGFIDENEDSIDDGHFLVWPKPDHRWVNMPTDRHAMSGTLSFLDGRVERWSWNWPKDFESKESYWKAAVNKEDLEDLRRLQKATLPFWGFEYQDYEP